MKYAEMTNKHTTEYTREQLFYARNVTNDILHMIERMIYDNQSLVTASTSMGLNCKNTRKYIKSCVGMRADKTVENSRLCRHTIEWILTPEERLYQQIMEIPDDEILKVNLPNDLKESIEYALAHSALDARDLSVISMRYWQHKSKTDIAKTLQLTTERVRQLCEKALRCLKTHKSMLRIGITAYQKQSLIRTEQGKDTTCSELHLSEADEKTVTLNDAIRKEKTEHIRHILHERCPDALLDAVTDIFINSEADSILELGLSRRAELAMRRAEKEHVLDILLLTNEHLLSINGVGTVIRNEIEQAAADYIKKEPGISIKESSEVRELLRIIKEAS